MFGPRSRTRRRPDPVKPSGAILETLLAGEDFADRPFGSHGAMLPQELPEEAPQPTTGLTVAPPPWQHELEAGDLDPALLAPLDKPPEKMDALAELKAQQEPEYDPPAPAGPPLQMQPLLPAKIPEVDWREEERLRRDGEILLHDLPKDAP